MNLGMMKNKIEVASWAFKCKHPLGRRWARLPRMEKFAYKLVALNTICLIVLIILNETLKSS
tara:strand:+ start:1194 stop:1379 length:186 start_codon:yes stop_codon:yes gene_type:complete